MSIHLVFVIPDEEIVGPPSELLELISKGKRKWRLVGGGMSFDGELRQISMKWPS